MKKIVIFGSSGHARVVLSELLKLKDYKVLGFIDNTFKTGRVIDQLKNKKYKILGDIKYLKKIYNKNIYGIIGVGSNFLRKKIAYETNKIIKNFKWCSVISKNSIISGDVKIDVGSLIISGSIINTGTKIGKHCIINTSSSIDHDNIFKDFSSTGPRTTTGGKVKVGLCSHIGIAATVKNNVTIQNHTIVGAKSLVLKNCEKNSIYFGSPAIKIRKRKEKENYL